MSKLETRVRALLDEQASAELPPSLVSVSTAAQRGRTLLRRRLAWRVGAPALTAAVVAGVVLAGQVSADHRPAPGPARPAPATSARPAQPSGPVRFDPATSSIFFGWLPPGVGPGTRTSATTEQRAILPASGGGSWIVTAYAAGQCRISAPKLRCLGQTWQFSVPATHPAPEVDGSAAYWGQAVLIFQYAPGSWAAIYYPSSLNPGVTQYPSRTAVLRVARGLTVRNAAPVQFPVRLTGLPGWQLKFAEWTATSHGPQLTFMFGFAAGGALAQSGFGAPDNYPWLIVQPAGQTCPVDSTTHHAMIDGYSVVVGRDAASTVPASEQLCAPDVRGLMINMEVSGNQPALGVEAVFRHMRVLGADPSHWTSSPADR